MPRYWQQREKCLGATAPDPDMGPLWPELRCHRGNWNWRIGFRLFVFWIFCEGSVSNILKALHLPKIVSNNLHWCGWYLAASAIRRLSPIIWKWVWCFLLPSQIWCVSKLCCWPCVANRTSNGEMDQNPSSCKSSLGYFQPEQTLFYSCQFLFWHWRFVLQCYVLSALGNHKCGLLGHVLHVGCDLPTGFGWCYSSRSPWLNPELSWICWKSLSHLAYFLNEKSTTWGICRE